MRYLIDGHNLIANLSDISLDDPDDEVKLIYKLRGFAARTGKKITVVFDSGLPGGVSKALSTSQVQVKFASIDKMTADQILLNELRKVKNPKAITLVSSDSEIINAAHSRRINILTSAAFAELLNPAELPSAPEKDDNPQLSAAEIANWLKIFTKNKP